MFWIISIASGKTSYQESTAENHENTNYNLIYNSKFPAIVRANMYLVDSCMNGEFDDYLNLKETDMLLICCSKLTGSRG